MLSCILNLLSNCENPHLCLFYFLVLFFFFLKIIFLDLATPTNSNFTILFGFIFRFPDFRKIIEDKIDEVGIFLFMSLSSITKYMDKNLLQVPPGPITKLPVLVSDSIGHCLLVRVHHYSRLPLHFFTYSGVTSAVAIDRAIPELSKSNKPLVVYVWFGVFDITKKIHRGSHHRQRQVDIIL